MTTPPHFIADRWQAHELHEADVPALQRFFDANPLYFRSVNGREALPDEARSEFDDLPPAGMPYSRKWVLKIVDETGAYAAMAYLLADFLAPRVWHIGLYIVETALHGSGAARTIYQAMEDWIARSGGEYIRLGAVSAMRTLSASGPAAVTARCAAASTCRAACAATTCMST